MQLEAQRDAFRTTSLILVQGDTGRQWEAGSGVRGMR